MGLSLKKIGRGLKKIAKKNQGGVSRLIKKVGPGLITQAVAATAPGLIVKAASAAKTLGKKVHGLETPKSLVPVIRASQVRVARSRSKMPGGAPMPTIAPLGVRSLMKSTPQAKRTLYAKKRKPRKKQVYYRDGAMTEVASEKWLNKNLPRVKKPKRKAPPPSPKQLAARAAFAARMRKK